MVADPTGLDITPTPAGCEFLIKVVPGASRSRIVGRLGAALKVSVSAAPEAGKANAAVTELLAGALGLRRGDVTIVSGQSRPQKRVAITGLDADEVRRRLAVGE